MNIENRVLLIFQFNRLIKNLDQNQLKQSIHIFISSNRFVKLKMQIIRTKIATFNEYRKQSVTHVTI